MEILANIFGYVIKIIYSLTSENYALSIIFFTIITKLILAPLSYKQNKSTKEMQKIKPEQDKIVEKYKNDKVKQSEEISKLYKEHNINPIGGCLPALIQIPLILSIFYIVKQPLTYVLEMPKEDIKIYASEILNVENVEEISDTEINNLEIEIAKKYYIIDMDMLGLNLGDVPANVFSDDENKQASKVSLIIPVLSVILSMIQIKRMQKNSGLTEEQKDMQKSMNYTMPIISGVISYTMPLALGIYWLLGSIIMIIQQEIINKMLNKNEKTIVFLNKEEKDEKNN